jgi:hypothetical protein
MWMSKTVVFIVEELASPLIDHWMSDKGAVFYAVGQVGIRCVLSVLLLRPGAWHYNSFKKCRMLFPLFQSVATLQSKPAF